MPPKKKAIVEVQFSSSDEESDLEVEINEIEEKKEFIPKTGELEVQCMELHDQILHRPDTYIGNVLKARMNSLLWVSKNGKIVKNLVEVERKIRGVDKKVLEEEGPLVSEGFIRTIIEMISNMIDNIWRSKEYGITAKTIKINIDRKTGRITTWNDGKSLSHGINKKIKERNITLICSRLLTSTNYDDTQKKKTSGKNGYGMKLTNIFSTEFSVESYNPEAKDNDEDKTFKKQLFKQTWKNNMYVKSPPEISLLKSPPSLPNGSGYTSFSWVPDFKKFGMNGFDNDSISVIEKYIMDTAMIVSKYNVKTFYNDTELKINSLTDYARLYNDYKYIGEDMKESDDENSESDEEDEEKGNNEEEIHIFTSSESRVVIIPFHEHVCMSFVNGILTTEGGVHVDKWVEDIFRPIVNKVNGVKIKKEENKKKKTKEEAEKEKKNKEKKKKETYQIDIKTVKNHFAVFIDTEIDNPVFRGQNKTFLGGKLDGTPIVTKVKVTDINKIMKWSVIEDIKRDIEMKEMGDLKSKKGFVKIPGYDSANNSKKPSKRRGCVLCISEGLSAKTYVVSGMKVGLLNIDDELVQGRDWIGALPIKGKFINPRGKSMKTVSKNKEVLALINCLGLEPDTNYTIEDNFSKLKYGRLCVFADADKDGIHIIGLLYNFFNRLFPSLLKVPGFFTFNRSPIMKVSHKGIKETFYYLDQARKFIEKYNVSKKNVKYYKGLGTSRSSDIETDFGKRLAEITYSSTTDTLVDNLFNPKKSSYRKDWIQSFDESKTITLTDFEDGEIEMVEYDDFANKELILFSIEDCKRSIPNLFDGLKESQRKILYSIFKKKLTYTKESLKVAQLSGYTAEHTLYEHGEDNLIDTIRRMAVRYPGSNNIPLLFNDGQFGSRLENGDDGSSGRYIFTKPEMYTRYIFPEEDDEYLPNIEHDGDIIEKHNYIGVIPMILINGSSGIGTGFSSTVPQYNPTDIISWVRNWIEKDGLVYKEDDNGNIIYETPSLIPYYRNFKGVVKTEGFKTTTYGVLEDLGKHKFKVSELPIGKNSMSISKFEDKLKDLFEKKIIKDYDNKGDEKNIDFIITEDPDGLKMSIENLGLVDYIHTSNMVLFKDENTLKKYETVEEIINEFCLERMNLYKKRREGNIKKMMEELKYKNNKIRFITEVNSEDDDKLVLKGRDETEIDKDMKDRGYDKKSNEKGEEDDDGKANYNYLLSQKISSLTKNKIDILQKEKEKVENEISFLKSKTPADIWKSELNSFEKKLEEWLPNADDNRKDGDKKKGKKKEKKESV